MIPRELVEITKQYYQSLNGKNRLPDFIFEKREYFETKDEPRLRGLVFYIDPKQKTIVFDKDPRNARAGI